MTSANNKMTSTTNNQCFPDTYKEILDLYPRYCIPSSSRSDPDDPCCDYFCCLAYSPIVIPIWLTCCFGVTGKKMCSCQCKKNTDKTITTPPIQNPNTQNPNTQNQNSVVTN